MKILLKFADKSRTYLDIDLCVLAKLATVNGFANSRGQVAAKDAADVGSSWNGLPAAIGKTPVPLSIDDIY